jgi:hypothetical protein
VVHGQTTSRTKCLSAPFVTSADFRKEADGSNGAHVVRHADCRAASCVPAVRAQSDITGNGRRSSTRIRSIVPGLGPVDFYGLPLTDGPANGRWLDASRCRCSSTSVRYVLP